MPSGPRGSGIALCVAIAALASGCAPAAEDPGRANAGDGSGDGGPHAVYIDRLVEHLDDAGRVTLQEGYASALELCGAQDVQPVSPLPADAADKVGTERWRFWKTPTAYAYRLETWTYRTGNPLQQKGCTFELAIDGTHFHATADRSVSMDLASGERFVDEGLAEISDRARLPLASEDALAGLRQRGLSGPTERSVLGQPCTEWRDGNGATVCRWSGGRALGFTDDPAGGLFLGNEAQSMHQVVLDARPAPGTAGARLTTTTFSLLEAFDDREAAAMQGEDPVGLTDKEAQ